MSERQIVSAKWMVSELDSRSEVHVQDRIRFIEQHLFGKIKRTFRERGWSVPEFTDITVTWEHWLPGDEPESWISETCPAEEVLRSDADLRFCVAQITVWTSDTGTAHWNPKESPRAQ